MFFKIEKFYALEPPDILRYSRHRPMGEPGDPGQQDQAGQGDGGQGEEDW